VSAGPHGSVASRRARRTEGIGRSESDAAVLAEDPRDAVSYNRRGVDRYTGGDRAGGEQIGADRLVSEIDAQVLRVDPAALVDALHVIECDAGPDAFGRVDQGEPAGRRVGGVPERGKGPQEHSGRGGDYAGRQTMRRFHSATVDLRGNASVNR